MGMFKKFFGVALFTLFSVASFAATDNKEYFTQYNIWLFKNQSSTLNYAVEELVPVNSKVKIVREYSDALDLKIGENTFTVALARRYSKKSIADIKARYLNEQPVDLSKFSKLGQEGIKVGEIKFGMTKQEVLVARGYPPEHATLSIDSDTWRYWQNKWRSMLVRFDDNKVSDIKD